MNTTTSNEGRVLVRLYPDSNWTAICYSPRTLDTTAYRMCRRLGYSFTCGAEAAGAWRTNSSTLVTITSVDYMLLCVEHSANITAGGCSLLAAPRLTNESHCLHEQDMWLSCGYEGEASELQKFLIFSNLSHFLAKND